MIGIHERQQFENQDSGFISPNQKPVQQKQQIHYYVLAAFVVVIAGILVFNSFMARDQDRVDAQFYRNHIMTFQLIDFWKMSEDELETQQKDVSKKILDQAQHKISRQELGHNSWTLLHMITGAFPDQIPEPLAKKFNAFLVLFGQMFPCKLCANHFMGLLKQEGLFKGTSKAELMEYLCNLHNKVNQRLKKPIHDCSNVYEEWNTCGCSQS